MVVVFMAATMMCGGLSDAAVSREGETEQEYVVLLEEDANYQKALSKVEEYGEVVEEIAKNQEQDAVVAELTEIEAEKIEQNREIAVVEKNISFDVSGEEEEIQAIQDVVDSRWNIKMVHGQMDRNHSQHKKVAIVDSGVACTSDIHVKEQVDSNGRVSDFNAIGEGLEILAPGENVPISQNFGFSSVGSGTSYAAAHVTAVATLLWDENPGWSCDKIRGLIDSSANVVYRDGGRERGLLDYAYARKVMKDFSVRYDEGGKDEEIRYQHSRKDIASYDVPEEVQASWRSDEHSATIVKSSASAKYSSSKLTVLKNINEKCDSN